MLLNEHKKDIKQQCVDIIPTLPQITNSFAATETSRARDSVRTLTHRSEDFQWSHGLVYGQLFK